jgi:hypothetical protein
MLHGWMMSDGAAGGRAAGRLWWSGGGGGAAVGAPGWAAPCCVADLQQLSLLLFLYITLPACLLLAAAIASALL